MTMVNLALYQPDIALNVGAGMRLCACLGIRLDIIEPCGFPWDQRKIRQSAMDYMDHLDLKRHISYESFIMAYPGRRIVLLTTKTQTSYTNFEYTENDILLAGRESAGVPVDIYQGSHAQVGIKMRGAARSLNVINACAMVLGEALRQT